VLFAADPIILTSPAPGAPPRASPRSRSA